MLSEVLEKEDENPMREVKVEKVVVHICVGESGQPLVNAEKILEQLTGQKPIRSKAKKTIQSFGIKRKEPISVRVTLRGKKAEEFLEKAFNVVGKRIKASSFDPWGNFAFGIEEHTDFPGMSYDPNIGIYGMDVMVSLCRRGYRVTKRRVARAKIPSTHRVNREDAIEYVKSLGVEVME